MKIIKALCVDQPQFCFRQLQIQVFYLVIVSYFQVFLPVNAVFNRIYWRFLDMLVLEFHDGIHILAKSCLMLLYLVIPCLLKIGVVTLLLMSLFGTTVYHVHFGEQGVAH
jgi:hypothetical protein